MSGQIGKSYIPGDITSLSAIKLPSDMHLQQALRPESLYLQSQMLSNIVTEYEPRISKEALMIGLAEIERRVANEKERERIERETILRKSDAGNTHRSEPAVRFSIASDNFSQVNARVDNAKSFSHMLRKYINEHCGGMASKCYHDAGISRQLYSQIISDTRKGVTKRTALQLCIGLRLDLKEAEKFLSYAGYAFAPSSFEDAVFAWCLENKKYNIFDVNEFLMIKGCEPISVN